MTIIESSMIQGNSCRRGRCAWWESAESHQRICRSAGRVGGAICRCSPTHLTGVHDEALREFFDEGPNLGPAVIVGVADDAVLSDQRGFKSGLVGASVNLMEVVIVATELNGVGEGGHNSASISIAHQIFRTRSRFSADW